MFFHFFLSFGKNFLLNCNSCWFSFVTVKDLTVLVFFICDRKKRIKLQRLVELSSTKSGYFFYHVHAKKLLAFFFVIYDCGKVPPKCQKLMFFAKINKSSRNCFFSDFSVKNFCNKIAQNLFLNFHSWRKCSPWETKKGAGPCFH